MNRIFIVGISLIAGALGGRIYMFARARLRARHRRLHREEAERMIDFSEFSYLKDLNPSSDDINLMDKK